MTQSTVTIKPTLLVDECIVRTPRHQDFDAAIGGRITPLYIADGFLGKKDPEIYAHMQETNIRGFLTSDKSLKTEGEDICRIALDEVSDAMRDLALNFKKAADAPQGELRLPEFPVIAIVSAEATKEQYLETLENSRRGLAHVIDAATSPLVVVTPYYGVIPVISYKKIFNRAVRGQAPTNLNEVRQHLDMILDHRCQYPKVSRRSSSKPDAQALQSCHV